MLEAKVVVNHLNRISNLLATLSFSMPLSPNVADLQHFDIVLFCGFSLCNTFFPKYYRLFISTSSLSRSIVRAG